MLLSLTSACVVFAQEGDDADREVSSMPDVVITATRTEQEVLNVPQHVTVITAEDIEKSGVRDLAQILNRQAGIAVQNYGALGALQNVSLRGSTAEQVLVLIDGVRVNNARDGTVDLSLIPLNSVERIEIVRGGTSALYGSDAIGGVINIITKKEAENRLKVRVENGSYIPQKYETGTGDAKGPDGGDLLDMQRAGLQFSRTFGTVQFTTSGNIYRAGNGYVYKDESGEKRKRENAGVTGGDITADMRLPLGNGDLDLKGIFVSNNKGVPGLTTSPSPTAEQKDRAFQGSLGFSTDSFFSDVLTFNARTYFNYSKLQYADPDYFFGPLESEHQVYGTGLDLSQEVLFFDLLSIVYGADLSYDWIESTDVGKKDRVYGGLFLETPLYLTEGFTLIPMVRYDYYSDFQGTFNFKLAASQSLSSQTSLKGSLSKSYRAPTFNQLYWPFDGFTEGNPDLEPETGYEVDFGITHQGARVNYNVFLFTRYVKDVIIWKEGPDMVYRPSNFDESLYPGLETQLRVNITRGLFFNLGYTFIYSLDLSGGLTVSDDERMPYLPLHELDFGLDFLQKRYNIGLNGHLESKRYYESFTGRMTLPAYVVLDAYYRHSLGKDATFLLSLDNLLNTRYEVAAHYPMPGIFIRTGFELVL
jgi:outer membrane cobalamin receptor